MTVMEKAWIDIGALDDVPRLGARVVKTPLGCIAVFRAENDEVYALEASLRSPCLRSAPGGGWCRTAATHRTRRWTFQVRRSRSRLFHC